jgi:hypothetical protein
MKVLKALLIILIVAGFSACEVQDVWHVNDTVYGTPTKADTILPHKFVKNPKSELQIEQRNENLPPVFRK